MSNLRRSPRLLAVATLTLSLLFPLAGQAEEEVVPEKSGARRVADITFDVLFLRPSGLVVFVTGCAALIPAAALTAPGGSEMIAEAQERFVENPAAYLFTRPLGEF